MTWSRSRVVDGFAASAASLAVGFAGWLAVGDGSATARLVVSDAAFVGASGLAAAACYAAARSDDAWGRAWRWLGAAAGVWCAGAVLWAFYGLVLGDEVPFPSLADVGFLGWTAPAAVGVLSVARRKQRRLGRLRVAMDAAVIGAALLFISWALVLGPAVRVSGLSPFGRAVSAAYPVVDVTLAALVLAVAASSALRRRWPWALLSAALLVEVVTDSTYVARLARGSYRVGEWLDLGWVCAFALLALAAAAGTGASGAPADAAEPDAEAGAHHDLERGHGPGAGGPLAVTVVQELLPYAVLAAAVATAVVVRPDPVAHPSEFWFAVALAVLALVRQVLVAADHMTLTRGLSDAVAARTRELAARERWSSALVANLHDALLVADGDRAVRYASPAWRHALGLDPAALTSTGDLRSRVHPDDREMVLEVTAALFDQGAGTSSFTVRLAHADGSWRWFDVAGRDLRDDDAVGGIVLVFHDVTDRHVLTADLAQQALHDPLTELPNRRALLDRIRAASARADRGRGRVALLMLDLDRFKTVNDSYGHPAGDDLLRVIAARLRTVARGGDLVARLGGDEFALVLESGPAGEPVDGRTTARLADRLHAAIREPVVLPTHPGVRVRVTASIGIALRGGHETAEELVRNADLAMYAAKADGKDRHEVFSPTMHTSALARTELEDGLRRALAEDEFLLHYQPLLDTRTGRICGVEALVRWAHPQRGLVPPNEFIPVAEATGLIVPLGAWVLRTACAQLGAWHRSGLRGPDGQPLGLSVNVSPAQLEGCLPDEIGAVLAENGLTPAQLTVEITETLLAEENPAAAGCLGALAAGGVNLSVDDFGTGYSSLARLQTFPIRELKIDRSFIAGIGAGHDAGAALVSSVVALAHGMRLEVVAEGVETAAQHEFLREQGCDRVQGFHLGRPAPADELGALLTRSGPKEPGPTVGMGPPAAPRAEEEELAALLTGSLGTDSDLEAAIRRLLGKLEQLTGFESTYLTRIDWDAGRQHILYARNTGRLDIAEGVSIDWSTTICRSMLGGAPACTADVAGTYADSPAATELGIVSYAGVPVHDRGGAIVGTLCAASASPRPLDARITHIMELFAEILTDYLPRLHPQDPATEPA